jgi:hypothetical protein
MSRWVRRCGLALAVALGAPVAAHAALLLPGQAKAAADLSESDPAAGSTLVQSITDSFSSGTDSGTLVSSVYTGDTTNPFGADKLTFTYQISNTDSDATATGISRLSLASFNSFSTDVSFQAGTGTDPSYAQRGIAPAGEEVSFDFLNAPLGNGQIVPGKSSSLLVIQTNASAYSRSLAGVGEAQTSNIATLAPISVQPPVPEPASIGLLGGAALLLVRRRRRA